MARRREAPDEAADGRRLRAFFALGIDGDARRHAECWLEGLAAAPGADAVRWVRPEGLHVTLRFLGGIPESRVPALLSRVAERTRAVPGFGLVLGGVTAFPSPRRARVVTLEAGPEAPLRALAAAVEQGVVDAGFPAEERRFRPHLTLGRVRRGMRLAPDSFRRVTGPDTARSEASDVTEALLFRSELARGGSLYTSIGRVPLGPPDPGSPPNP